PGPVSAGRADRVVGPGFGDHQLRRREDLRRGGRTGRGRPSRRVRRRGGGPAVGTVGSGGGGGGAVRRGRIGLRRGAGGGVPAAHRRLQGAEGVHPHRADTALAGGQGRLPVGETGRD